MDQDDEPQMASIIPPSAIQPIITKYIDHWFGRRVNEENDNGCVPLAESARNGDETSVFLLLHWDQLGLISTTTRETNRGTSAEGPADEPSPGTKTNNMLAKVDVNSKCRPNQITALQYAAAEGHASICRLLLDHGADVNYQNGNLRYTPLHLATARGHPLVCQILLEGGANPNLYNVDGCTPLHTVASAKRTGRNNNVETIASLLVENGGDVNKDKVRVLTPLDATNITPLDAAANNYDEILEENLIEIFAPHATLTTVKRTLVDAAKKDKANAAAILCNVLLDYLVAESDSNETDDIMYCLDEYAFAIATHHYESRVLNLLVDHGVNYNVAFEFYRGRTLLHVAAEKGLELVVSWLLNQSDIDVNVKDRLGLTPVDLALKSATSEEDIDEVESLLGIARMLILRGGADVKSSLRYAVKWLEPFEDIVAYHCVSPRMQVHEEDFIKRETLFHPIVQLLIGRGCDVTSMELNLACYGLHCAIFKTTSLIVHTLLDAGAVVDSQTRLELVTGTGSVGTVRVLVDNGANVDARAEGSCGSPLELAIIRRRLEMVEYLVDNGAKVDSIDIDIGTPLHVAARHSSTHIVRVLLNRGARVNACNISGCTPLHLAAFFGCVENARLLLNHGADPTMSDSGGDDAMEIAREQGHVELYNLLRDHMGPSDGQNASP